MLVDFLRFGQENCRADRYVISFYGHAYGPMGLFFDAEARQRDANTLRLNDLASSMETVQKKAAVVVFRDCFMNTLETAYQLRHAAEFMVASQSVVPVAGVWPWAGFMSTLMPSAGSADVGRAVAMQLACFLEDPANRAPFEEVPCSLLDLGAAETIVDPLKAVADALDAARLDPRRAAACAGALEGARVGYPDDPSNPGDPALLDVPTLCDRLQVLDQDPVAAPARALGEAVRNRLVRWPAGNHTRRSRTASPRRAGSRARNFLSSTCSRSQSVRQLEGAGSPDRGIVRIAHASPFERARGSCRCTTRLRRPRRAYRRRLSTDPIVSVAISRSSAGTSRTGAMSAGSSRRYASRMATALPTSAEPAPGISVDMEPAMARRRGPGPPTATRP